MSDFKYNEQKFLSSVLSYIKHTYGEHYAHDLDNKGMQLFDLWEGLGSLDTTARDTAIKYLTRFGRKNGHNSKDLYKAIHYICILAYATESERNPKQEQENNEAHTQQPD